MNVLKLIPRNRPRSGQSQAEVLARVNEDVSQMISRNRFMGEPLDFGPNWVHAVVGHGDTGTTGKPGTFTDLGWSRNLKTTAGMDWLHDTMGGELGFGIISTAATATTATSMTFSGTPFVASAYVGHILVAENGTDAPVWANIGANTTSAFTIDSWHYGGDTAGASPAATANALVLPGGAAARYMALTTATAAPVVGDTTLTAEQNASGVARALALYAHTPGATTYTLYKLWTASGDITLLHKAGLFTAETLAAAGIMVAATALNADATLANLDTLAVTWTWTLPAAG